jgi:hypothetical protein
MNWIEALVAWNKKHGGKYTIPRKGTKEHAEVLAMMGKPPAERFIQEVAKTMKKGAMTKTAKRHGKTPLEYSKEVLAHPEEHTLTMRRWAQFLVNIQH